MVSKSIFFHIDKVTYDECKELRRKYKVSHKAIYIAGMALLKNAYEMNGKGGNVEKKE